MENIYIIKNKSFNKLLDNTSNFEDRMAEFIERHPDYKYNIKLDKDEENDEWFLELKINSDEQKYTQESKDTFRSRSEG